MHEYSIVQSLLESCEEHAKSNDAKKVTKVVVKIGILSGVEPELLKTAFDTFKEQTVCHDAQFLINHQKIEILCQDCNTKSTLEKHEFSCPKCQSTNLTVTDGEDMYLMSLEME
ncbi:hydrogenase/urease nickel incorporation protein HypA [Aliarcobacter butzleri]|uniref:hydrogenase/urease nickel incorporation protein HypA n=1 Tax=Aliarcobacter butzleri TaxID=28197 RepID=UPI0006583E93|nr:hydrogenase/urease nickel incorporation protein HypA [Aliarcobacter butzleri]KLE04196.1 hydrogenase nickel incorporation protein HypA [Aliarcobacter butzleri L353]MCG3712940.1 hydrogenase/urease nickel incorporation protein HypA [Aliarcobacter butzleri]MCT7566077.1 hydrogenase/urease nickel incorporation protein HypA [Aliarcobacter butzleri]MCT7631490.1 hydrogenase/urease nickel incorporation protein HypA [Aliarcobacter butzleri]